MDMTVASAQRAATLTHRLLAFSRRQALDTQAVDVNGVVRSMEELLRRTLGENIVLETALAQDLGPARTDSHQLESALLNLVINARDAMPSGGRLVIETAAEPGPHDPHAEAGSGPVVILRVRDTGVGMSPGVVARAFDPFFTTKPIGAGTGLGLSMVYGFVRQSNGEIRITSIEGRGTTVSMMLPRDIGAADAVVSAPLAETPEGSGESVLVVEDDPGVRMLALDVLNDVGYRTLVAENAEQALAILRSGERIDLLLTDVGLPGLNGRQLAEIARQRRPGLSVLFMTGYAEIAGSHPSFLDQGMGMIVKPFDVDSLATRVREVIGSRPAHMGAA
jgi:CheY-like chemotaxis protein